MTVTGTTNSVSTETLTNAAETVRSSAKEKSINVHPLAGGDLDEMMMLCSSSLNKREKESTRNTLKGRTGFNESQSWGLFS